MVGTESQFEVAVGVIGGKAPPLQENVKMEVERRKKRLWWVTRGVES